jgi:hypothetical protein
MSKSGACRVRWQWSWWCWSSWWWSLLSSCGYRIQLRPSRNALSQFKVRTITWPCLFYFIFETPSIVRFQPPPLHLSTLHCHHLSTTGLTTTTTTTTTDYDHDHDHDHQPQLRPSPTTTTMTFTQIATAMTTQPTTIGAWDASASQAPGMFFFICVLTFFKNINRLRDCDDNHRRDDGHDPPKGRWKGSSRVCDSSPLYVFVKKNSLFVLVY